MSKGATQSTNIFYLQIANLSTLGSRKECLSITMFGRGRQAWSAAQQFSLHLNIIPIETIPAMNGVTGWAIKPLTI